MLDLPDELDEPLLQRGLGVAEVFDLGAHFHLLGSSGGPKLLRRLPQLISLRLHQCQSLLHAGTRNGAERGEREGVNPGN